MTCANSLEAICTPSSISLCFSSANAKPIDSHWLSQQTHTNTHKHKQTQTQIQSNPSIPSHSFTHKQSNTLYQGRTNNTSHSQSMPYNTKYSDCRIKYRTHFSKQLEREMHQVDPECCFGSLCWKRTVYIVSNCRQNEVNASKIDRPSLTNASKIDKNSPFLFSYWQGSRSFFCPLGLQY